jgi:hypothetical protein
MFDRAKTIDGVVALAKPKTAKAERALRARLEKLTDNRLKAAFKRSAIRHPFEAWDLRIDLEEPTYAA